MPQRCLRIKASRVKLYLVSRRNESSEIVAMLTCGARASKEAAEGQFSPFNCFPTQPDTSIRQPLAALKMLTLRARQPCLEVSGERWRTDIVLGSFHSIT